MTKEVSTKSIALKLDNISKTFGSVKANQNICIEVEKGTIHGIIGENGAGKSTLMNIIYAFYEADEGDIYIQEKLVKAKNSLEVIEHGVGMVHQHFMQIQNFTVLENVILGATNALTTKSTLSHARDVLKGLSDSYGLHVDPDALIEDLPVGARQRVEILKALYRKAQILILDEPTGVLTPQEADQLFKILEALRNEGVTTILITHKLREIMAITDNVSVMHHGKMVAHRKTNETNVAELAELMVGRKVRLELDKKVAEPGDVLLKVENLSVFDDLGVERLKSVSFEIRQGEVVGIAGVSGNGQTELLEVIAGMMKVNKGSVSVMGKTIDANNA
ncbi:MAG: ATP-binding cassette domain-containing protein, partial [Psychromonas sp.]|nr:ATP-binding cassette domain-containing protein [Psychromonas sp.]